MNTIFSKNGLDCGTVLLYYSRVQPDQCSKSSGPLRQVGLNFVKVAPETR